jgi:DNA repair photolyase
VRREEKAKVKPRSLPIDGRGTSENPPNRFERIHIELGEIDPAESSGPSPTVFYRDSSKTVLAENDSPDLGFRFSVNPYRGCEHGCVYCYARPSHEYLSFSAGLDFETRIMIKQDAPDLLRRALLAPKWVPQTVALSGNTDCYQPIERRLRLTRRCLEVFLETRNPVSLITKSHLVTRDVDVLSELAGHRAVHAFVSITTLDADLARRLEPRAATPARRIEAVEALRAAGIPVGVMVAPVIPGLNDSEIPAILNRAASAGAQAAGWILMRLPKPVDQLFVDWVERHFPERRERILGRVRQCRAGNLSDVRFGHRMRGQGVYAEQIRALFQAAARRAGLDKQLDPLSTASFRRPPRPGEQLGLYDS